MDADKRGWIEIANRQQEYPGPAFARVPAHIPAQNACGGTGPW
jgi:hypothetical protein